MRLMIILVKRLEKFNTGSCFVLVSVQSLALGLRRLQEKCCQMGIKGRFI